MTDTHARSQEATSLSKRGNKMKCWLPICLSFLASFVLIGCAHQLKSVTYESQGVAHKYEKNYALNKLQKAYVGEPIIRVKDYYVEKVNIPQVEPSEDFSVETGLLKMKFSRGKKYSVSGTTAYNSTSYQVILSDNHTLDWSTPAVLIDKEGTILYAAQTGKSGVIVQPTFNLLPTTARMISAFDEKVSMSKGYENYELLFNGIDKNSMTFTYREFSPEGIARAAFYQNLTYDASAKVIRFKKFKIDVFVANSEGITYTVLED